ncbi:hypothetical protein B0H13DRAFT_2348053 [Mycena leptocephala]|nr:hypothetical protein B0H13DRAFT_2348053 [Mycena leptocephala]
MLVFMIFGSTPYITAPSPDQLAYGNNAFTAKWSIASKYYESAIWSYDPTTKALTAQFVTAAGTVYTAATLLEKPPRDHRGPRAISSQ